ncbi:uncharacterized protein BDZ99DRAFT_237474 [Mytilinidion resinicola]|uniref:Uncharacterized protein n=1 Tax=Mytilinidion resinicola TaxID=574789 RepID=A0A6A6YZT5_9PEZI|nr:uncharacterized protein BDZ99DRAFT_237474 [Mytilinidion resinicola]KAF2814436.1 hypothetical protein BDZ99DRAFT_237474 [Mytilinidion resinicola]
MAHSHIHRSTPVDFGGHLIHEHEPTHDAMNDSPKRDQRTPASGSVAQKTNGGHDGAQSSEDQENDGEEADSSADQDVDEDEEDPDVMAPSYSMGKGKGKRPAIRVEPVVDEEDDEEEVPLWGTGPPGGKSLFIPVLAREKKRTFSNVSINSVLFDSEETNGFPRRKIPKRLSNSSTRGLLTYKEPVIEAESDSDVVTAFENAIDSGDEEAQAGAEEPGFDDEDYSGVLEVSDDSDVEEELERQDEQWLIAEAEQMPGAYSLDRRFSVDSDAFNLLESNLLAEDIPDVDFHDFFSRPDTPDAPAGRKYSSSSTKRVRFDDDVHFSDSSSSDDSDAEESMFPDLFMPQDKLDPDFRMMIENDEDEAGSLASDGSEASYWSLGDGQGFAVRNSAPHHANMDDDSDTETGSSGYDSDSGDTTDEEDFEPMPVVQAPQSVLRRPSSSASDKPASPQPFQRSSRTRFSARQVSSRQISSRNLAARRPAAGQHGPPRCGVFTHEDWSKAIAVTNRTTELTTYYRPRRQLTGRHANYDPSSMSSSTNNSPRTSIQAFPDDSDYSEFVPHSMVPSDIMLSGVFGAAPNSIINFGGQVFGPPEAFYPFVNFDSNGELMIDDDDDSDYSDDDVDITDLVDFGDDPDETDAAEEIDVPATPATSMIAYAGSTPAQPSSPSHATTPVQHRRNASDAMLEHFDRAGGVVTAFRNNQNRFRDFARLPFDPNQRASASRPVRSGRSADTLISPLRKKGSISKRIAGPPLFSGVTKARSETPHRVARGPSARTFA